MRRNFIPALSLALFLLGGCYRIGEELEPRIDAVVQDRYLKSLPSPFPPLSETETHEEWGREQKIALKFAHELDLYQAIASFKRASFLIPENHTERLGQIEYDTLLAYYLGKKFTEVIHFFETTSLRLLPTSFTPYHDLLVMLYDANLHLNRIREADGMIQYIASHYPETAQKLFLSKLLIQGDIPGLEKIAYSRPEIQTLLDRYNQEKKSTTTAQTLNVILPGAGYLYLGQTQSAFTAFLLSVLFIWASIYAFRKGNIAAGIIFATIEIGWYFGGIYGAGGEAKFYNEQLYERYTTSLMNEHRLFPILMLKYGF